MPGAFDSISLQNLFRNDVSFQGQIVNERYGCSEIQLKHLLLGKIVELHDDRPVGIAMSNDQNILALNDVSHDAALKEGKRSCCGHFE